MIYSNTKPKSNLFLCCPSTTPVICPLFSFLNGDYLILIVMPLGTLLIVDNITLFHKPTFFDFQTKIKPKDCCFEKLFPFFGKVRCIGS